MFFAIPGPAWFPDRISASRAVLAATLRVVLRGSAVRGVVVSRRRWASKKVRAGLSSRDYVSMHTYVSLTLAKTPHLPIKRRKVSRIDQPPNREARDGGGWSRDATRDCKPSSSAEVPGWSRDQGRWRWRHVRQPAETGTAALACSLRRSLMKCGRLSGTVFLGTLKCMQGCHWLSIRAYHDGEYVGPWRSLQ